MILEGKRDAPLRKQRCVLQPMSPDSVSSELSNSTPSQHPLAGRDGFVNNFFVEKDNKFLDAIEDLILGPNNEDGSVRDSLASSSSRRSYASDYCEQIATIRERRTGSRTASPTKPKLLPPRPLCRTSKLPVMKDTTMQTVNAKLAAMKTSSSSDLDDMLVGLSIPLEQMSPPKGQWKMLPNTAKRQQPSSAIVESKSSESEVLEFDTAFDFEEQEFPEQRVPDKTRRADFGENDENRRGHFGLSDKYHNLETIAGTTPALHTSSTEEFEIVFHDMDDDDDDIGFPDIKGSLWGNPALWETWGSQSEKVPPLEDELPPKRDKWAHISPISEDTRSNAHSVPSSPFDTPRPSVARREPTPHHRATTAKPQTAEKPTTNHTVSKAKEDVVEDNIEVPFSIHPAIFDSHEILQREDAPTELGGGCASPIYAISPTRLRSRSPDKSNVKVVSTTDGVELETSKTFVPTRLHAIDENKDDHKLLPGRARKLTRSRVAEQTAPQIDTSHVSPNHALPKTDDGSVNLKFSTSTQSKSSGVSSRNGSNRSFGLKRPPVFFRLEHYAKIRGDEEAKRGLAIMSPSLKWAQRKSHTVRNSLTSKWRSPVAVTRKHAREPLSNTKGGKPKRSASLQRSIRSSEHSEQTSKGQSVKTSSTNHVSKSSLQELTQVRIQPTEESEMNTISIKVDQKDHQSGSKSQVSCSSAEVEIVLTPILERDELWVSAGDESVQPGPQRTVNSIPENDKHDPTETLKFQISGMEHTSDSPSTKVKDAVGNAVDRPNAVAKSPSPEKARPIRTEKEATFSAAHSLTKETQAPTQRKGLNSSIFSSPALRKVLDLEACPQKLRRVHQKYQQSKKKATKEAAVESTEVGTNKERGKQGPPRPRPMGKPEPQKAVHCSQSNRTETQPVRTTVPKKVPGTASLSHVVDAVEAQLARTKLPPPPKLGTCKISSSQRNVREMMKVVSSTKRANRIPKTVEQIPGRPQSCPRLGHSTVDCKLHNSGNTSRPPPVPKARVAEQMNEPHHIKSTAPKERVQPIARSSSLPRVVPRKFAEKPTDDKRRTLSLISCDSSDAKEEKSPSKTARFSSIPKANDGGVVATTKKAAGYGENMSQGALSNKSKIQTSSNACSRSGSVAGNKPAALPPRETDLASPPNLMKRRRGKQQAVTCPGAEDSSIQDEPCLTVSDEAKRIVLMNSTISSFDATSVAQPSPGIDPISSFLKLQEIRSAFVEAKDKTPANTRVRKIRQAYNHARRSKGAFEEKKVEEECPATSMISLVSSASTLSAVERKITERLAADVQLLTEIKQRKKELSTSLSNEQELETKPKQITTKSPPPNGTRPEGTPSRPSSARVLKALSKPNPETAATTSTKSANFSVYKMAKWMNQLSPTSRRQRSSLFP